MKQSWLLKASNMLDVEMEILSVSSFSQKKYDWDYVWVSTLTFTNCHHGAKCLIWWVWKDMTMTETGRNWLALNKFIANGNKKHTNFTSYFVILVVVCVTDFHIFIYLFLCVSAFLSFLFFFLFQLTSVFAFFTFLLFSFASVMVSICLVVPPF